MTDAPLKCTMIAMASVLGIDIGGTKIAAVRYDSATWQPQAEKRIPTNAPRGFAAVIDDVVGLVNELRADDTTAVGVGVPGPVSADGVLRIAPNIPQSENVPLQDILQKKLSMPVSVNNDNQGFAYAESVLGAGKGKKVVVAIAFGTGVGGGIVIDGKIYGGAHGAAGEFGHTLLQPGNPPFTTEDQRGEVEQFLSGSAWKKRCAAAKKPEDYMAGDACSFLHPLVYRETAWLCANLIYALDPDIIVIGGSAGRSLKEHIPNILDELKHWLLPNTPLPHIAVSELKGAGMLGAALLASGSSAP